MAQAYFSLVTTLGRNKLAASAAGGPEIVITHFAVGDGNGAETNPVAANTALVREVWRTPIESVVIDPDNPSAVLVTAIIPTSAGGWYMREFGIFDQDGAMIAVAKPVSQYKPTALEGQLEDIRYEFQIIIGETANVTMLVDPSVLLASRDWVSNRRISMGQLMRLPWVPVISMTITAPPAAPSVGDTYAIPPAATGVWAGHAQELAEWTGTSWGIINPPDGHGISLPDGRVFLQIAGVYLEKLALDVQSGKWNYAVAGGTANALTMTFSPTPMSMASIKGVPLQVMITTSNIGPVTANLNGFGVVNVLRFDGAPLQKDDLVAGRIAAMVFDGIDLRVQGFIPSLVKIRLVANLTITINFATGNDANPGTVPLPFKTIQAAVDYVYKNIDLNGFNVVFNCSGAFTAGVTIGGLFIGQSIAGQVTINLGTASIQTPAGSCLTVNSGKCVILNGSQLSAFGAGAGQGYILRAGNGGEIQFGQLNFGNCSQAHILSASGATITAIQDYTISSTSALYHLSAIAFGSISISGRVVVMVAGLTAATFASSLQGAVYASGTTFTGAGVAATICNKFSVDVWGSIFVGGAGVNFFPGSAPGAATSKGDYR